MEKPAKDRSKTPSKTPDGPPKKTSRKRLVPPILTLLSLFLAFAFVGERCGFDAGFLGSRLIRLLSGTFGLGAVLIPPLLAILSLLAREDFLRGRFLPRSLFALLFLFAVSTLCSRGIPWGEAFSRGTDLSGGGVAGAAFRRAIETTFGPAGIVLVTLSFPLFYFVFFPPAHRVAVPAFLSAPFRKRGTADPPAPPKARKELPMSSRQNKTTIVGGDGYYPVAHREDESFSEIRSRMEKEERTGAERRGVVDVEAEEKRPDVDISIDPTPDDGIVFTRSEVSSPAASAGDSPDVVSAAELFGKPGFAFTEEFNRTPPPSVKTEETVPLRAPASEPARSYVPPRRPETAGGFVPDHTPIPPAYRPTFSGRPSPSSDPGAGTPYIPTFRPGTGMNPAQPENRPAPSPVSPAAPTNPAETAPQTPAYASPTSPASPTYPTPEAPAVQPATPVPTVPPVQPVQPTVTQAQPTVPETPAAAPVETPVAERNPFTYTVTEHNVTDGAHRGTDGLTIETSRVSDAAAGEIRVGEPIPSSVTPQPSDPYADYCPPTLSLLKPGETVMSASSEEEIRKNAEKLIETLDSFHIAATINHVSRGPRITRYELRPDKGVRIRNITALIDDISMALATPGIRIEAPIPGIAAVGVEVPNKVSTAVRLRDMLDNDQFREASSKTTVCVGSDVTGHPVYGDIAKMPHALIAGATGMGKSVCINSILISLLYKARPDEVKLILVDPKKVELGVYNGIPHLLVPVVVEPQKAAGALVWAVGEMERRFNLIEQTGVRNLKGYNQVVREHPELGGTPLPQIVIVIDELNDLMMSARDAVEDAICRIAQKARAAGIHLLIGTQRPSVDVITGVIKANIPSRLAFHVASQVDSRTILDTGGAEKLLDRGDMLFFPVGSPKPIRVQGALVDDDEVERVTDFLKQGVPEDAAYDSEIMANIEREAEKCAPKDKRAERDADGEGFGDDDDIFHDPQFIAAVEIAVNLGQISTSKIQTKLRIGFQKATNFIDRMEEMGIVGPHNGSKPRDVLISAAQFLEMKSRH